MKFTEFNLHESLLEAISYLGFENATPIQEQAIPQILANRDLIACAQTGTGKTSAFVLPLLDKLIGKETHEIDTLIIVPTRELAIQIEQEIQGLSYFINVSSQAIYGGGSGKDWDVQKDSMNKGADIIVATPGKLLSLLQMGYGNFKTVKHLVLDEADRMLNMGFIDDLQKIFKYLPDNHQSLMFSATMPDAIRKLAQSLLQNPVEISLSISKPAEGVDQKIYLTYDSQKIPTLSALLSERKDYDSIIVFTSAKIKVNEILRELRRKGFPAEGISSDLEQQEREEVLRSFKSKRTRILVATDVMSRGIDVKEINLVVNYDVPRDAEDYVHRVGRTARGANNKGEAITLVNEKDMPAFAKIEKLIESDFPKLSPPDKIGAGPEWNPFKPKSGSKRKFRPKKRFSNNQKSGS